MRFDENKSKTISVITATALGAAVLTGFGVGVVSLSQSAAADTPTTKTQTIQQTRSSATPAVSVVTTAEKSEARKKPAKDKPKKDKKSFECKNKLAQTIYRAGFRGHNIREAWAISMRESNGQERQISNGVDHGLFQFNYPAWGGQSWWNTEALLDGDYNAKIAYKMSDGGRNWGPWGMRDHAEWNFASYGMWSDWQIQNWIIGPYMKYYNQYPC